MTKERKVGECALTERLKLELSRSGLKGQDQIAITRKSISERITTLID